MLCRAIQHPEPMHYINNILRLRMPIQHSALIPESPTHGLGRSGLVSAVSLRLFGSVWFWAGLCRFRCFVLVLCWSLLAPAGFAVLCWFCVGLCWSLLVLCWSLLVAARFCSFRCFVLVLCWSLLVSAAFAFLCCFCVQHLERVFFVSAGFCLHHETQIQYDLIHTE